VSGRVAPAQRLTRPLTRLGSPRPLVRRQDLRMGEPFHSQF
jgi:hypothetical protein